MQVWLAVASGGVTLAGLLTGSLPILGLAAALVAYAIYSAAQQRGGGAPAPPEEEAAEKTEDSEEPQGTPRSEFRQTVTKPTVRNGNVLVAEDRQVRSDVQHRTGERQSGTSVLLSDALHPVPEGAARKGDGGEGGQ